MKDFIDLLTQIKTFSLSAEDFLSKNHYTGNGNAEISSQENSAILKCSGKWKDKHNNVSSFTFSYRFIFDNQLNEISIEHMRYREKSPVYLCNLKQHEPGYFISKEPHVCNEDLYSAELLIKENTLHLNWSIKGQKKNIKLNYKFH